ncbi:fumarylacetoacetase [Nitratireductor sp. B36]|uniref:fumarylacetoacetase n=1 Tax=Nitratireductor sp. B36 TaxID=2762059 RepID=UPI001E439758|nr:fumarylacetoacetase [Nitratireductor sp. B36]MCC5781293.1 fumarylacetoacetase [Nitratireductor sp. B36]
MTIWMLDETHDPQTESWVSSANRVSCDFALQNLPYGVAAAGDAAKPVIVVAIGDQALNLSACAQEGLLDRLFGADARSILCRDDLNALMARSPAEWRALRLWLHRALRAGSEMQSSIEGFLLPIESLEMRIPARIGDYTDFYCSVEHATNVGRLFRPDNPLLPNFKSLPVGYHGRASSIVVSNSPVRRPNGQIRVDGDIVFAPSRMLDYELELGAFIGGGKNDTGVHPLPEARERLFGVCLVNDWSARDIQAWEYQPLGPFLSKSFATTISPWVVTMDALAPFRVAARERLADDPALLDYLADKDEAGGGALNVDLTVHLQSAAMRKKGEAPLTVTRANAAGLYWTFAQMITHHMSNGCPVLPGDLIASGTISGETPGSQGCLLELTRRGAEPLDLGNGESRSFLQDGDEIVLEGRCEREGFRAIGFGECRGAVLPASDWS